jgi:hypothetical protein
MPIISAWILFSFLGVPWYGITYYLAVCGENALQVNSEGGGKFSVCQANTNRSFVVLFVIFLIPGIPKDLFTYAAGVSEIRIVPFLLLSLIGRAPAMIGSILMGSMFYNESYVGLVIVGAIAVILFIAGLTQRHKLVKWVGSVL